MGVGRFDHMGMVVHDIDSAIRALAPLGYTTVSERYRDDRQGIDIVFVDRPGAPRLELVQPVREGAVVENLLAKSGATPYHLCLRASPLDGALEQLEEEGYAILGEPAASPAFQGAMFCFLYHRDLGMIELVEGA